MLYVDGKLDGSVDTPPPAPCWGDIVAGSASGKEHHLNAVVTEITIAVPVARKQPEGASSPFDAAAAPVAAPGATARNRSNAEAGRRR
jgi:hypothetical protein